MKHDKVLFLVRYGEAFLKILVCFLCFFIYFLAAGVWRLCLFFYRPSRRRCLTAGLTQLFARCLVLIMRVTIEIQGDIKADRRGNFFVSNHLSYLDGFILGALFPVVYVTKTELKNWPLIGFMTELSGTLFIDRNHKDCLLSAVQEMAETLKAGGNVLYFPESTSSNGDRLLPFVPVFFEAPLAAGARVVPVSLCYQSVDRSPLTLYNRDKVYWYADMTFFDHFFNLLACRSVRVIVKIHPYLKLSDIDDHSSARIGRKQICEMAYEAISKGCREGQEGLKIEEICPCIPSEKVG